MTNTDTTTQAVVEPTNAAPPAAAEVVNAREGDDLENLLKEFEQKTQPVDQPKPATQPGADPDLQSLAQKYEHLEGFVRDANARTFRQDMDRTIKDIRGDLDPEIFDNDLVESFLDGQARKDPRLAKAWTERNDKPKQFEKIKAELGKSLAKKFAKLPNREATEDREAVTAAVRGASNQAPVGKPTDYSKMSDGEFGKDVQDKFGFRPF